MTINDWQTDTITQLKACGIESAELDVLILLEHYLDKDRSWVIAHDESVLNNSEIELLSRLLEKRLSRIPLAYITNNAWFYGREFYVDEQVLIPRPESESIISLALSVKPTPRTVIDVGTGSGCLAVSLYIELHRPRIVAIDVSSQALDIARKNAHNHQAEIEFLKTYLLENISDLDEIDLIVANLPYVPDGMITSPEITKEPAIALFSGESGLDHYESFWAQISTGKHKVHSIITESLESQHSKMQTLAAKAGYSIKEAAGLAQLWQRL